MTKFFSKICEYNLLSKFNNFSDENLYSILSFTFRFFKKKLGYKLDTIKHFRYFFVQVDNRIYTFPVKNFKLSFFKMRFSSIFWLFFFNIYNIFFFENKTFKHTNSAVFWNFLIYLIFKGVIIFGFKSVLVVHGFWPKYLYTPEKLFSVLVSVEQFNKNPQYTKVFKLKKKNTPYNFSIIFKKKKKFFSKKITYFKSAVFFPVSNLIKLFTFLNKKIYTIFFIRKQKFFNKGRYSRNRQLYRTGVYWCIYVNILAVFGLNYLFYKFTVNFLQYWWFFFSILCVFILPNFFKSSMQSFFKSLFFYKEYINIKNGFFSYEFFLAVYENLYDEFLNFVDFLLEDFL